MPLRVRCEAARATRVTLRLRAESGAEHAFDMKAAQGFAYAVELPGNVHTPGLWRMTFLAHGAGGEPRAPNDTATDAAWFPVPASAVPLLHVPSAADAATLSHARHAVATATVTVVDGPVPDARALRLTVDGIGEGNAAAGYALPFRLPATPLARKNAGLRARVRADEEGARLEIGFRMRNGQGLGCNLTLGSGWNETLTPADTLLPLWGLSSFDAFRWDEVEQISVLTGAWLFRGEPVGRQTAELAALDWVCLERAFPLRIVDDTRPWSLFDPAAWLRARATKRASRVSTCTNSPDSRYAGTWIVSPVSSFAALVCACATDTAASCFALSNVVVTSSPPPLIVASSKPLLLRWVAAQ